jgi:hypothetical protein
VGPESAATELFTAARSAYAYRAQSTYSYKQDQPRYRADTVQCRGGFVHVDRTAAVAVAQQLHSSAATGLRFSRLWDTSWAMTDVLRARSGVAHAAREVSIRGQLAPRSVE